MPRLLFFQLVSRRYERGPMLITLEPPAGGRAACSAIPSMPPRSSTDPCTAARSSHPRRPPPVREKRRSEMIKATLIETAA
jgi:hypothetical protein